MSLNTAEMRKTAEELALNLERSGLTKEQVAADLSIPSQVLESALEVDDADPVVVWLLRDYLVQAIDDAGRVAVPFTVLTDESRRAALRWFQLRPAPRHTFETARPGGVAQLGQRPVSRIGYGAMQLERLRDRREDAVAVLRRSVELGIDHIDTAQFYGNGFSNELIREALAGRDDIAIVSKIGADPNPEGPIPMRVAQRPEELRASVEDNLRSLGLDQIPVVNLRRMDAGAARIAAEGDQAVDLDDQLAEMIRMRDEGLIGGIGLSSVTIDGLRQAIPAGIVCVQNAYSLINHGDDDMLDLCIAEGIAWVPYFPLGSAFAGMPKVTDETDVQRVAAATGSTPSQVGLAWLLHRAPNILLIPGTASVDHLESNVAAGSLDLDEEMLGILNAVPERAAGRLG